MTTTKDLLKKIKEQSASLKKPITIMEVCGGHTNTIMKYGIRQALPKNIKLISGPGCPVCVSSQEDIDNMIELALKGVPIATYGDMLHIPGSKMTLEDTRSKGSIIHTVYSATQVISLRHKYPNIIFFGIGFETTAPMSAYILNKGIPIYSIHKTIIPAMKALIEGQVNIDGFLNPGHVSAIIGSRPFHDIQSPQVISGFYPQEMLKAIYLLIMLISKGQNKVINAYPQIVKTKGNIIAQDLINTHFKITDGNWRGLGTIPNSAFEVREDSLNVKLIYKDIISKKQLPKKTGCRCSDILKGIIDPYQCPLFKTRCTPQDPQGACMVSNEGSCQIAYRYNTNE